MKESGLATRIIEEFAEMHRGLLPSMALDSLAAVRTSTKKILDKFSEDMDCAFLVHRGLILQTDDAFEQLPELLAEEALAVMADNALPQKVTERMSIEAIDSRNIKLPWKAKQGKPPAEPGHIAKELLKYGPKSVKSEFNFEKDRDRWISELHTAMGDDTGNSKRKFATLYNTRTIYSNTRRLTFGTIIGTGTEDNARYSMCLMPICDCSRLKEDEHYSFPFWNLATSNVVRNPGVQRLKFEKEICRTFCSRQASRPLVDN